MTLDHPRFPEFLERLGGPEGCNFRDTPTEGMKWDCAHDKAHATAILRAMGLSFDEIRSSFAYFEARGGGCDCEIVFNVGDKEGGHGHSQ